MKCKFVLLGMALISGMGLEKSSASPYNFLLTINDADPSAVIFTATGHNASVDDSSTEGRIGAELLGFFSQTQYNLYNAFPPNSALFGSGMTLSYNCIASDNYSTEGGDYLDLGFFVNDENPAANDLQTFSTTSPAFSGSWTINLAGFEVDASALPADGSRGQIMSGFSGQPGNVIGAWEVVNTVPEPSAASFLLFGSAAGFAFWRRRARKNVTNRA
jgi:hypothetical protein